MQMMFHIFDIRTGEKILCMKRQSKFRTSIKIRKSGADYDHLRAEEEYLNDNNLIQRLKAGEVIHC